MPTTRESARERSQDPSEDGVFPLARCERCEREVLWATPLDTPSDGSGEIAGQCPHCEEPLAGVARWVSESELLRSGYVVDPEEPEAGGGCDACSREGSS